MSESVLTPERQRAVAAVAEIARLVIFAGIDRAPFPSEQVSEVVAALDPDARMIAEEMLGEMFGERFRRTAGRLPPLEAPG